MLFAAGFVFFVLGLGAIRIMNRMEPERTFARAMGYTPRMTRAEYVAVVSMMLGILLLIISISIWSWHHLP